MNIETIDKHIIEQFKGLTLINWDGEDSFVPSLHATNEKINMMLASDTLLLPFVALHAEFIDLNNEQPKVSYKLWTYSLTLEDRNQIVEQIISKFHPTLETDMATLKIHSMVLGSKCVNELNLHQVAITLSVTIK